MAIGKNLWKGVVCALWASLLASGPAEAAVLSQYSAAYSPLVGGIAVTFANGLDEGTAVLPLGFTYRLGGVNYTHVGVSTNGTLELGTSSSGTQACGSYPYGGPLPVSCAQTVLAPWWGDLKGPNPGASVRYSRSNGTLTVEYQNWGYYKSSATGLFTFQVRFIDSSMTGEDRVEVAYGDHTSGPGDKVVAGIQIQGTAYPFLSCSSDSALCGATNWPANSVFIVDDVIEPELLVRSVTVGQWQGVGQDLNVSMSADLENIGQTDAGWVDYRVLLSVDNFVSADDLVLFNSAVDGGTVQLPDRSVANVLHAFSITQLADGFYWLLVEVDSLNAVVEPNEANNIAASVPRAIGVDLRSELVSPPPALVHPGDLGVASVVTFYNEGSRAASFPWWVVLSRDPTFSADDVILHQSTASADAGSNAGLLVAQYGIPLGLDGGTYYLGVVADPGSAQAPAGISGDVNPSNNAAFSATTLRVQNVPAAIAQSVTLDEDMLGNVALQGTDPDGDPLTFEVVIPPRHGALKAGAADGGTYVFTPEKNYHGPDVFLFRVKDGTDASPPAAVNLTITPVNDAPEASDSAASVIEDATTDFPLEVRDVDGNVLTVEVVTEPVHGQLTIWGTTGSYTPEPDYSGPDSFTFKVSDGVLTSPVRSMNLSVQPAQDPPVAQAGTVTLLEDMPQDVTLGGTDIDGDPLVYMVVSPPSHGTLSGTPPTLQYIPAANFNGEDTFSFLVNDGVTNSAPVEVRLTVTPVNDPPSLFLETSLLVTAGNEATFTVTAADVDGDNVTLSARDLPAGASFDGAAGAFKWKPNSSQVGSVDLTVEASDGTSTTYATVSITVEPGKAGGCSSSGSVPDLFSLLALGAALRRRRAK